jgi:predicted regulator of Ras-like GTPase activity (Roadblock/LC7/MglB family)
VQAILSELGALMGVKGSFVCGRDGAVLVRAMPDGTSDAGLAVIGRSLMQTLTGLEVDRRKRPSEMEFVYANVMLLIKNLGMGCLCVLCARQANVPMVNMTANMAARKLKEALAAPVATPVIASPPAPSVAAIAVPVGAVPAAAPVSTPPPAVAAAPASAAQGPCLPLSKMSQIEHELARAVGPVAMLAMDDAVAAMGVTRDTLPAASASAWIDRLAGEIADAQKRAQFVRAAQQIVRAG